MSASESVTMRLISSGMERSKLRRPASTWATGISSLAAAIAAAIVEFTSPTTIRRSKRFSVRRAVLQHCLHLFQDSAGLCAVAARTHFQPHVRLADAKVLEKDLGEVVVVVLAGVDQADVYIGGVVQCAQQRRHLHEVGRAPTTAAKCNLIATRQLALCLRFARCTPTKGTQSRGRAEPAYAP